jgi:hypothetical protein
MIRTKLLQDLGFVCGRSGSDDNRACSLASCTAKTETPPVPCVRTTSPGAKGQIPYRPSHAVTAAKERVEPSSQLRDGGMSTRPFSLKVPYSRRVPTMTPPRHVATVRWSRGPPMWPWLKSVTTFRARLESCDLGQIKNGLPTGISRCNRLHCC